MTNVANPNVSGIYKISSAVRPDKCYIGSAINIRIRTREHIKKLRGKRHHNAPLQNHINRYGIDDLKFEVVEVVEQKERLLEREQHYLDSWQPTFNICKTAGNTLGVGRSAEARLKMSVAKAGKRLTLEHRMKCSEALKGRVMTDDHKAKIGVKSKGHKRLLGYKHTEATRKKHSDGQIGHVVTAATREKLRLANLGKRYSAEVNKKKGRKLNTAQTA